MQYVSAFVVAVLVWLVTVFVMGMLIGQAFDGITGFWQIVPLVGVWGTSIGVAALAFRHSLRRSNEMLRRQRFLSGLCPICGYDLRANKERCPECGMAIAAPDGARDGR